VKKAAFLLIAAAWLTGSAHGSGRDSCCAPASCCDSCCDRPGLLERLRGLFHRKDCCQPCCEVKCAPACPPTCASSCDHGCGHRAKLFHRKDCCAPACPTPTCHTSCKPACAPACPTRCDSHCDSRCDSHCDSCCDRPGLLDRLRARFHRHDDCCDACGSACCGGAVAPKSGETITTPPVLKKLPGGTGGKTSVEPPSGEVRIITPSAAPVAPPAIVIPGAESRSPF
jgi:hypothetical protein